MTDRTSAPCSLPSDPRAWPDAYVRATGKERPRPPKKRELKGGWGDKSGMPTKAYRKFLLADQEWQAAFHEWVAANFCEENR